MWNDCIEWLISKTHVPHVTSCAIGPDSVIDVTFPFRVPRLVVSCHVLDMLVNISPCSNFPWPTRAHTRPTAHCYIHARFDSFSLLSLRTHNNFVWIMCTTDRGPNEIWTKKVVQAKLMDVPWCFFLPADCYEHQAHLGVLGGLKLVDSLLAGRRKWKYFSSVAMLTNILRDISQDLYTAWRTLHGDESANKCVRTLFPRCIAERWGSIDLTETRLLNAGVPELRATMVRVFQRTEYNDSDNGDAYDVDMLAVEEKKEYRKRMGRWRTSSMSTLRDPLFDGVVQVMNLCRKPFIHLSNYLKAKVLPTENAPMFRLVVGKGTQLGQAFDDMLWGHWLCNLPLWSRESRES